MDRPLVVLDTETATLLGAPHLLELAAIRVMDGEIVDTFESYVCPRVPIDAEATAIHGIDESAVRSAPHPHEVLAAFSDFVGDAWMAAHHAPFDARVLGYEFARARRDPPRGLMLDSLRLSRRWLRDAPDHKLPTLCEHLALEASVHHRALPDAVHCWKVIEACIERMQAISEAAAASSEVSAARLLSECGRPISITMAVPATPHLPRRLRGLERALEGGASITLLYGEGLERPAPLTVQPRFLFERRGKGYLEAECQRSFLLKTYRLDRIAHLREQA
jgi:DNA polymerase III epsilon subunit-like protein